MTPRNVPLTPADPTLGDWSPTDATATGDGYAACALTYELPFDDNSAVYCNSAAEERKARTVKDWLTMVVNAGQGSLHVSDYDALPGNILAAARIGVQAIDWKKDGSGRPCQATPPPPTTTPPAGTPGGSTPPPSAPSNLFTVASARAVSNGNSIRLSLQLPGAGKLSVASSAKPSKGKAIKLATKNVNVASAGTQVVTVALSSKAKKALKKSKLKVTMTITFTPTGGTPRTATKTVTVKARKAASRR